MEIVNSIKSRIGSEEENKLSELLGEPAMAISKSLDLALNAMLGGLREITKSKNSAESIQKVINDGGHSGDIIEDLSGLFSNTNKTKLLITIGENINNHFFKPHVEALVAKISAFGGVNESSAASLFSLSAPLILGALGKNIKLANFSSAEFTHSLMRENVTLAEADEKLLLNTLGFMSNGVISEPKVAAAIPAVSSSQKVNELSSTPTKTTEKVTKKDKAKSKKQNKKEENFGWLAWVLLGLLGLGALYYGLKERFDGSNKEVVTIEQVDSTAYKGEEDIFDELDTDRNKNNVSSGQQDSGAIKEEVLGKSNSEQKSRDTPKETLAKENIKLAKTSERKASRDTRSMTSKLSSNGRYFGLNGLRFKKNSAEFIDQGAISELVDYLFINPSKVVEIAGAGSSRRVAEDRAYALRGLLYEKGIDISRLIVSPSSVKGADQVMVKVD